MSLYLCTETFNELIYRNALRIIKSRLVPNIGEKAAKICIVCTNEREKLYLSGLITEILKRDTVEDLPFETKDTLNDVITIDQVNFDGNGPNKVSDYCIFLKAEQQRRVYAQWEFEFELVEDIIDAGTVSRPYYDAVIIMSAINWICDPEKLLRTIKRNILKPGGRMFLLTWHLPPTSLINSTDVLEKYSSQDEKTHLYPWTHIWMVKEPTPILQRWGADLRFDLAQILMGLKFNSVTALHLNKADYYCYEDEKAVKDFVAEVFLTDTFKFGTAKLINVKIGDENILENRDDFVNEMAEAMMKDSLYTNGHRLNAFQSLAVYDCTAS